MPNEVTIPVELNVTDLKISDPNAMQEAVETHKVLQEIAEDMNVMLNNIDPTKATKALVTAVTSVASRVKSAQQAIDKFETELSKLSDVDVKSMEGDLGLALQSYRQFYQEREKLKQKYEYDKAHGNTEDAQMDLTGITKYNATLSGLQDRITDLGGDVSVVSATLSNLPDDKASKLTRTFTEMQLALQQVTMAQNKLNETAETDFVSKEYRDAEKELSKLEAQLNKYNEKSKRMIATGSGSEQQWKNLQYDVQKTSESMGSLIYKMRSMVKDKSAFVLSADDIFPEEEAAKLVSRLKGANQTRFNIAGRGQRAGTVSERFDSFEKSQMPEPPTTVWGKAGELVSQFVEKIRSANPVLDKVVGACQKIAPAIGKAVQVGAKVTTTLAKGFKKVVSGIGSAIKSMKLFGKSSSSTAGSAGKSFKKLQKNIMMFGLGFRSAYYLVKRLRTTLINGFKGMAAGFDPFNKQLSGMVQRFNELKGSLATAFQPLLSAAIPIINTVLEYLTKLLVAIAKFNAILTGQSYILKANAKAVNVAADSASGAADEMDKKLGQYDKLEVIQTDDGNKGGAGTSDDLGVTYSKAALDGAASEFAKLVKEAWAKSDFTEVGEVVSEKIIGALDYATTTIIPKVAGLVNKISVSIVTFIQGFDWAGVGQSLGNLITTAVASIDWTALGEAWSGLHTGLFLLILHAIANIDWSVVAQGIHDFIHGALSMAATMLLADDNPISQALGQIFQTLDTTFETLWANIQEPLTNMFNTIITFLPQILGFLIPIIPIVGELVSMIFELANMLLPIILELITALMPIATRIVEAIMPVLQKLLKAIQPILNSIATKVLPFLTELLDALMPIIEGILDGVSEILEPLGNVISTCFDLIIQILEPVLALLKPIFDYVGFMFKSLGQLLKPILDLIDPLLQIIGDILSPITELLKFLGNTILTPLFSLLKSIGGFFVGVFSSALSGIVSMVKGLSSVWKAFGDVVRGAFDTLETAAKKVWDKVKPILNGILGGVESLANGVVRAINRVIDLINGLKFDIPDWVPVLGGKTFGFNLSKVSEVHIPRLAQGAVIPPNKEFIAMLGDQTSGTNIEAPLDTIKQAVAEVLAQIGGVNNAPIVLQLDGKTVAQVVWNEESKRYKQTGRSYAL